MRIDVANGSRCTVQRRNGAFCDTPSGEDMPFPICPHHAVKLYEHMRQALRDIDPQRLDQLAQDVEWQAVDEAVYGPSGRLAREDCRVYYVRIADLIKIGCTWQLGKRLATYPPHSEFLGSEAGYRTLEQERHRQFAHLLARGREWFRPGPDLLEHIATLHP